MRASTNIAFDRSSTPFNGNDSNIVDSFDIMAEHERSKGDRHAKRLRDRDRDNKRRRDRWDD